ncbi:MAG: tetratricopeptide repeat-containing protein [Thermodesulfobacteriota bacterium]
MDFSTLKKEVARCKREFKFGQARALLEESRPEGLPPGRQRDWLFQQLALCTYKDEELPPLKRFRDGLAILDTQLRLRDPGCRDPETLGLAGAVYKRLWEHGGQLEHLHTALSFYRQGWARAPAEDRGYCGANAAFILDLLDHRARRLAAREGLVGQAGSYAQEAKDLRRSILARLADLPAAQPAGQTDYWLAVTVAECHWGLEEWEEAGVWLARAAATSPDEWTLQSTAKQLVAIARLQGINPPAAEVQRPAWHPAWQALAELLGKDTRAALGCHRGKVGLALSGGGFRAALFHLGVLARLAECDVLRSVEVLSTVSGGSIVGAHYYLELRRLLQTRTDGEINREDYVLLVQRLMKDFLAGVSENLRVRAFTNLADNLRMIFLSGFSRSNRMGRLYERHLYARVRDGHAPGDPRPLRDLLIHPLQTPLQPAAAADLDTAFKPKFSNWRREAKVPILLLNTTSLNSGHNWHFTASWMGEPPGLLGEEVDVNERYRRLYYHQAPSEELRSCPLGYAVAASAGVPALFEPLVLEGLYPGRTVRLVDGGVHDNQGVAGLLDEGCTLILCSDASGQMDDQADPASGMLSVFYRSDSILQDRLRETQYQDLASRVDSHALAGLFFIHLKQELETAPIDWIGCQEEKPEPVRSTATSYGVDRAIQRRLSEIRTDLDSFTEVEAYALMASGYQMTTRQLHKLDAEHRLAEPNSRWGGFDVDAPGHSPVAWPFKPLVEIMAKEPESSDLRRQDLERQLAVSRDLFLKAWKLSAGLRRGAMLAAVILVLGGAWYVFRHWSDRLSFGIDLTLGAAVGLVLFLIMAAVWPVLKLLDPAAAGRSLAVKLAMAAVGWLGFNVHLKVIDPFFLRRGRLARLLRLPVR